MCDTIDMELLRMGDLNVNAKKLPATHANLQAVMFH